MQKKEKVTISEAEKSLPFAKYYAEEMAPIPQANLAASLQPCDTGAALPIEQRNRLFEPGYLPVENGYCVLADGTGFVASRIPMPGVTGEMFDWWFAWHALGPLRYTIWDPEDHYEARCLNRAQGLHPKLSYKEKYWGATHLIREDIGMGPVDLFATFRHPQEMGFLNDRIGSEACETIVTSNGGSLQDAAPDGLVMCHFLRKIPGGTELRTRFWMGWHIINGKDVWLLPACARLPLEAPRMLYMHAAKEFSNLARLLPRIYAEERNHW